MANLPTLPIRDGFFRDLADAERMGKLGPEAHATTSERFGITWL